MLRLWKWLWGPRPQERPIVVNPDKTFTVNDELMRKALEEPPRAGKSSAGGASWRR